MNKKIDDFNLWLKRAKPNDKYTYHSGNLAHDSMHNSELRELGDFIMNCCCKWTIISTKKIAKETDFKFKNNIRLFQKVVERWTVPSDPPIKRCNTEYYAIKI